MPEIVKSESLEKIRRLIALATNLGTSIEERKTAATLACREMVRLGMMATLPSREECFVRCDKIAVQSKNFDMLGFMIQTAIGRERIQRDIANESLPKDVYANTFHSDFSFKQS